MIDGIAGTTLRAYTLALQSFIAHHRSHRACPWHASRFIPHKSFKERVMALSEVIQPNKIRLPWSLRGKVEVGPLQLVGQNALGLPYVQGQIRNRSGRPLHLKIVVRVLNEQRQPIFAGSPGILEVFDLDAQQQRAFRISLRDQGTAGQLDRQRMWVTRSGVEISIEG